MTVTFSNNNLERALMKMKMMVGMRKMKRARKMMRRKTMSTTTKKTTK